MKYNFIETVHECHFYGFTPLLEAPESNGCLTDDYDRLKNMRAIVVRSFGAPEVLKLEQVAIPKVGPKQVLVSLRAAGVNPTETYARAGKYTGCRTISVPFTPGGDGAGVVEEVGSECTKFKVGDHVFTCRAATGTYAEKALVDETRAGFLGDLSFEQGAGIGVPYFTAYRALVLRGHAKPGETVLVHGASGGTGLATCQIGKAIGLRVVGTAGTPEGLELVRREGGADAVYNHRDADYVQRIKREVVPFGLVVEMLADKNLRTDIELSAHGGRICIIGSRGSLDFPPVETFYEKEVDVRGISLMHSSAADWAQSFAFFAGGIPSPERPYGWLRPHVGQSYPLERAPDAHREVIEHSGGSQGKIVLLI